MNVVNPANRTVSGKFKKGTSGNPSGRPKTDPEVKELLKGATYDAVNLMIQTMHDEEQEMKLRISIAESIVNRVLGKPTQQIDADISTATAKKLEDYL